MVALLFGGPSKSSNRNRTHSGRTAGLHTARPVTSDGRSKPTQAPDRAVREEVPEPHGGGLGAAALVYSPRLRARGQDVRGGGVAHRTRAYPDSAAGHEKPAFDFVY
jgi:hypothetical protein